MNTRRGVTLVELLCVLGIVAALMVISIPVLRTTVTMRHDTRDLAHLSQTMRDLFSYGADNADRIVNAGLPWTIEGQWFYPTDVPGTALIHYYEGQRAVWHRNLHHWGAEWSRHWHSAHEPVPDTTDGMAAFPNPNFNPYMNESAYRLSATMLTKPSAWLAEGLDTGFDQYAANYFAVLRWSDVRFPSGKGVLVQNDRPYSRSLTHVAFADGSASLRDLTKARPTAAYPVTRRPGKAIDATLDGCHGIDY